MNEARYFAPSGMDEALKLLAEHGQAATVLAGGTDLVPRINYYELKLDVLLFIGGLGLDYVKSEGDKLIIGAAATQAKLAEDPLVAEKAGALAEAARQCGSPSTRNMGTIGGNIGNASPGADMVPPLLAMDAELKLVSAGGERQVPAKDFFVGPGKTILKPGELIQEIQIPPVKGTVVFLKLGRRAAMTLSVVNVAVRLDLSGKRCNEARIALGSVAPTAIRCAKAEGMLAGQEITEALIKQCAEQAMAESQPIDDQRATAWYRLKAGAGLVARALSQAAGL